MSPSPDVRKKAALGIGSAFLLVCCIAGPAIVGAIGGAATGSILLGASVAALVAVSAHLLLRRSKRRADC